MESREALARAMKLNKAGSSTPWEHDSVLREAWLEQADIVIRHLQEAGFVIARADARKGEGTG